MLSNLDLFQNSFSKYEAQFGMDAPRMSFYMNDESFASSNVSTILTRIQNWCDTHNLDIQHILPWCTQIPYATLYEAKQNTIVDDHQYLFDNGRQIITLDTHSGTMHIVKPFRIDTEKDNGDFLTMQSISLHITVYNNKYTLDWIPDQEEYAMPTHEHTLTIGMLCTLGLLYWMVR
jgi:hypothetical protein